MIVPGIYFPSSGNAWAPNLWGHEQVPLRQELERVMPLPVVIDSDRAGYVIGERWRERREVWMMWCFFRWGRGLERALSAAAI